MCSAAARLARLDVPELRSDARLVVQRLEEAAGGAPLLTEAETVVCGGRGMGSRAAFALIYELAEALGGAPAASRAAVDAGFAPPGLQVGQSGKTVSPALYLACGVSGSLQHLAGMRTSRCVVAINSDARAPIFRAADYGIVGDVRAVLPALIEEARRTASYE
jgi:electron transfer flavoprotein alpha subunit